MSNASNAFNTMAANDAAAISSGELSEPITYRPGGNPTKDVVVNAVVFRNQIASIPSVTAIAAPVIQIFVTTAQVPNPEKGDQFLLASSIGGKIEAHPFTRRIKEDVAGFLLELR